MVAPPFIPDSKMAQEFLYMLDPAGIYTFQTFDDAKKNGSLVRVLHGTFEDHKHELSRINAQGGGVFVMINKGDGVPHPGNVTCRTAKNVVAVRSLFADLDGAPLEPVCQALQPDMVVESSPGRWHAYWLTNDCPLHEFSARQAQIAAKFGADPAVKDLPRVMRVPGFFHRKRDPFMTRLVGS